MPGLAGVDWAASAALARRNAAQRFLLASEMRSLASGLSLRLGAPGSADTTPSTVIEPFAAFLYAAQRFRWAAAILRRPAALNIRVLAGGAFSVGRER